MDTNELMVTEATEIVKNTKLSTLKTVAKYGGVAVLVVGTAYGVYRGVKKVVGLMKKRSADKQTEPEVDVMDIDLEEDYSIDK